MKVNVKGYLVDSEHDLFPIKLIIERGSSAGNIIKICGTSDPAETLHSTLSITAEINGDLREKITANTLLMSDATHRIYARDSPNCV